MSRTTPEATDETAPLVGHVAGENLKRLRNEAGVTQAEAARRLQANGVRWTRSQVAAFEAGNRESVDIGVLVLMARCVGVPAAEFFAGEGSVRITPEATWTRRAFRELLSGGPTEEALTLTGHAFRTMLEGAGISHAQVNPIQADTELASRLGVPVEQVVAAAERLWGHAVQQERERQIAEMEPMTEQERRTRRGHITRRLAKLIEPEIRGNA